jgi:hypothetical protein
LYFVPGLIQIPQHSFAQIPSLLHEVPFTTLSMQWHDFQTVVSLLDTTHTDHSPSQLCWPSSIRASNNFTYTTTNTTALADYMRRPAFLLRCLDGTILLISEREAHFIFEAIYTTDQGSAQRLRHRSLTSVAHLSFARTALPVLLEAPKEPVMSAGAPFCGCHTTAQANAACSVVAAQVFAGETLYRRLQGPALQTDDQDDRRFTLLKGIVGSRAGGDSEVEVQDVDWRKTAVLEMLTHRGRAKHFADSCLDDVCCELALDAMADIMSRKDMEKKRG